MTYSFNQIVHQILRFTCATMIWVSKDNVLLIDYHLVCIQHFLLFNPFVILVAILTYERSSFSYYYSPILHKISCTVLLLYRFIRLIITYPVLRVATCNPTSEISFRIDGINLKSWCLCILHFKFFYSGT